MFKVSIYLYSVVIIFYLMTIYDSKNISKEFLNMFLIGFVITGAFTLFGTIFMKKKSNI